MEATDHLNRPLCTENTYIELCLHGKDPVQYQYVPSCDFEKYNAHCDHFSLDPIQPLTESDQHIQWVMPEYYRNLDILQYIQNLCPDDAERQHRVQQELELYKSRNLLDVLRLMVYIVDSMRKTNTLWGVGRGSSVSSYCLYLIGVHRIDSVKYQLDISEFLRKGNSQ